jgi:hypothetical protein
MDDGSTEVVPGPAAPTGGSPPAGWYPAPDGGGRRCWWDGVRWVDPDPPGWYPDPTRPSGLRWWGGTTWGGETWNLPGPPPTLAAYQALRRRIRMAWIGLVVGIVAAGFSFFGAFLGPVAAVLGQIGYRAATSVGDRSAAKAGLWGGILGIVGFGLGLLWFWVASQPGFEI